MLHTLCHTLLFKPPNLLPHLPLPGGPYYLPAPWAPLSWAPSVVLAASAAGRPSPWMAPDEGFQCLQVLAVLAAGHPDCPCPLKYPGKLILCSANLWSCSLYSSSYPTPTTNPVNQLITSPVEADKIAEAAQREADNIMAIAFPSGPEPPLATIDTVTTQTAQSVPPTAPSASTATTAIDHLDRKRQPRPTSPAFMMNAIPDNQPGPTTNPLLVVNTGQDGNTNSFITPTLVTHRQNHQGNGNTVAFENTIPKTNKQINTRLIEIANQGPSLETMATSCPDSPPFMGGLLGP